LVCKLFCFKYGVKLPSWSKTKKKPPENLAFGGKTKRNPQENQFFWGKTKSAHLVLPNLILFLKKVAHYSSFYHQNWHISLFHQNKEGKEGDS